MLGRELAQGLEIDYPGVLAALSFCLGNLRGHGCCSQGLKAMLFDVWNEVVH